MSQAKNGKRSRAFDWDRDCRFGAATWLQIEALAKERGIVYPRARRQEDGTFLFMSGMTLDQLFSFRDEIEERTASK